jgi:4-diphosphocytidyl-2-C-methyl-D-erythritol kinase
MNQLTLRAFAKLNLTLDITGRRADGYHLMEMAMQSIDLSDTLILKKEIDSFIRLGATDGVPTGKSNTAVRAAHLFFTETKISGGVSITLKKHIPMEAGMAGGSADAAAVLVGLNRLFDADLTLQQLQQLGLQVGADVPFCIVGGTATVTGIGERVIPHPAMRRGVFLVAKPQIGVSTAEAFSKFDKIGSSARPDAYRTLWQAMRGQPKAMAPYMANVLEEAAGLPEILQLKQCLTAHGADCALMTGSGSAVYGLFSDEDTAQRAYQQLANDWECYLAKPVEQGVQIVSEA